ncbi:uncharacterized protein LOC119283413 [Triticum dicoccoides]|uniref:uncharacterized protein LOC119283413 n=1 Tax=Triticum dicoccoides TaxID=85692 RepID=UPI00188FFF92|nr:uncharacterized protein LOC119283413 [Triticum dicoccoides]
MSSSRFGRDYNSNSSGDEWVPRSQRPRQQKGRAKKATPIEVTPIPLVTPPAVVASAPQEHVNTKEREGTKEDCTTMVINDHKVTLVPSVTPYVAVTPSPQQHAITKERKSIKVHGTTMVTNDHNVTPIPTITPSPREHANTKERESNKEDATTVVINDLNSGHDLSLEPTLKWNTVRERHLHRVPVSAPVQYRSDVTGRDDYVPHSNRLPVRASQPTLNRHDSPETHSNARIDTIHRLALPVPAI